MTKHDDSAIFDSEDQIPSLSETPSLETFCYFNNTPYNVGDTICIGNRKNQCRSGGYWLNTGVAC
jgi:hypothetical protein